MALNPRDVVLTEEQHEMAANMTLNAVAALRTGGGKFAQNSSVAHAIAIEVQVAFLGTYLLGVPQQERAELCADILFRALQMVASMEAN